MSIGSGLEETRANWILRASLTVAPPPSSSSTLHPQKSEFRRRPTLVEQTRFLDSWTRLFCDLGFPSTNSTQLDKCLKLEESISFSQISGKGRSDSSVCFSITLILITLLYIQASCQIQIDLAQFADYGNLYGTTIRSHTVFRHILLCHGRIASAVIHGN